MVPIVAVAVAVAVAAAVAAEVVVVLLTFALQWVQLIAPFFKTEVQLEML
jgi:hypothetical protein